VVGFGSSKEDKVDRSGDPDSLFWKARFFLKNLPPEFRGSWDESEHSAHLRLQFPDTGSPVIGEAGDQIGRGGRSTATSLMKPRTLTLCRLSTCPGADTQRLLSTDHSWVTHRHASRSATRS
jgi:hypothetical protein